MFPFLCEPLLGHTPICVFVAEDLVLCLELQGEVSLMVGQGGWEYGKAPLGVMLRSSGLGKKLLFWLI